MKALIIMTVLFSFAAQAQPTNVRETVICKRDSKVSCEARVYASFKKLGCAPVASSIRCIDHATAFVDGYQGFDYCEVQSQCKEAFVTRYGEIYCDIDDNGKVDRYNEVDLSWVDSKVAGTTMTGLLRNHVTRMCRLNK